MSYQFSLLLTPFFFLLLTYLGTIFTWELTDLLQIRREKAGFSLPYKVYGAESAFLILISDLFEPVGPGPPLGPGSCLQLPQTTCRLFSHQSNRLRGSHLGSKCSKIAARIESTHYNFIT